MNIILSIQRDADRDQFMADAAAAGAILEAIEGMPRHFLCAADSLDAFILRDHPAIRSFNDADEEKPPSTTQSITLDVELEDGSWAIARTIRRDAPWNVDRIKHPFETNFRCARDGTGVDIYTVDSGIYLAHSEFGGRATNVYEFSSTGGAGDDYGHGTLTASAAAGATTGIARGALLWSFRSSTSSAGGNSNASIVAAIGQLLTHYNSRSGLNRPAVVNLSISPTHNSTVVDAIDDLIDAGLVCVLSAGNEADLLVVGTYPVVFTVDAIVAGGTGMADIPYYRGSDSTNYGSAVHILAPGQAIRAAAAPVRAAGDFENRSGTSISTPFVVGVIACMLQGHDRLTTRAQVQAVKAQLLANATTGRFRTAFGLSPLPDKILYLDPDLTFETIPGL